MPGEQWSSGHLTKLKETTKEDRAMTHAGV